MKKQIKRIISGILIGIVAFPTITLGGTFVSSLIQGKTVEEAIQILVTQIDSLIGRVTTLETRADREEACRKAGEILEEVKYVYSKGIHWVITAGKVDDYISGTQTILEQYEWLVESQDLLCLPTPGGIETYCTKIQEMSPEIYNNRPIISCGHWSDSFPKDPETLKEVEYRIQYLQNEIQKLNQKYTADTKQCEPFTKNIPQGCFVFKYTDQDLDCCYKYSPPEEYSEGFPVKSCCMFFYEGKEMFDKKLAKYNNNLGKLQSSSYHREEIIKYLEEVYCKEKTDFSNDVQELQTKLNRLQELKTEYLIQKELCEQ